MVAIFAWPVITMLDELDQRSDMANIPLVIPQIVVPLGIDPDGGPDRGAADVVGVRHDDVISSRDAGH